MRAVAVAWHKTVHRRQDRRVLQPLDESVSGKQEGRRVPLSKKVASDTPLTLQKQPEDTGEGASGLCKEQGCPEELPPGL